MTLTSSRGAALALRHCLLTSLLGCWSLAAGETAPTTSPTTPAPPAKLAPFEVTGSLIKRVDFEGPSPIRVITRAEIDLVAGTGLTDILRELPEATNLAINEATTLTSVRGASGLDLRSLGAGNTLILVNGRRQAPNGISSAGTTIVDLNRVPTAMIERVEILKDGASAIYGADATAGVVNLILRKNFNGAEISARYGNYFRTDANERSASVLVGGSKGRVRGMIGLSYSSRAAIAARDLPLTASADQTEYFRALDPVKYASQLVPSGTLSSNFDGRSPTGPYATIGVPTAAQLAAPRNGLTTAAIRNPLTGATATFLPGTGGTPQGTLGSATNYASVPRASNPGTPVATQFVARSYDATDLSNSYNFQEFAWNTSATERMGVTADFGVTLTNTLDLYGTLSWVRLRSETHLAPAPISTAVDNGLLVPASNYYNPFGIPVAFTYRSLEVGPRIPDIVSDSLGAVFGVRGTLASRFDWDLGWSYSRNESSDRNTNNISESKLRAALAKSTPDAFNIFGGRTFRNDPATIESIKVTAGQAGDTSTAVADFHLSTADLFALPWGSVGSSVALEHRLERFNVTNDDLISTLDDIVGATRGAAPTRSRRDVQSVAAELRLPLVSEGRLRWLHTAEVSTAARFERFSDGYDSGVKPFAGLRLRLTPSLLLRASYGQVFRTPSLPQLYGGVIEQQFTGLPDLRRPFTLTGDSADATTAPRTVRTGGNPTLKPEDGTTRQVGAVFDAPWKLLRGLTLEATYGIIEQDDVIRSGLGATFIRQNELTSTGDLVIREPGTQTFTNTTSAPIAVLSGAGGATTTVAPGQSVTVPGRITTILDAALNLSNQIVRYYDFGLRYRLSTDRFGTFTATSNWTYYQYYASRRLPTEAPVPTVGRSLPRYRSQSSLAWQRGDWGANLGLNYIHRYRDFTLAGWEVPRYYTVSAGVSHTFTRPAALRGTQLSLGVDNLLDRDFPIDTGEGYNKGFIARPAGRFAFVSLRRSL